MGTERPRPFKSFGQILMKWRKRKGFNRISFAKRLGVSVIYLASIERGFIRPDPDFINRLREIGFVLKDDWKEFFEEDLSGT